MSVAEKDEPTTFRTGVADVRVDAQVSDGSRLIAGLTHADFNLYDNRLPQPIKYFGHEKEPITLLLLLDVSGSMDKYVQE
ncbi:MAG: hypothetical protein IAG10_21790, partial [Planctomycetaceae bacterium]|nr:hypothetical protein [Planctomycetaceae bacterium]